MIKTQKTLYPLAVVIPILLSGCVSNEVRDPSKSYVTWHTLAQKADYAGVDIIKINGNPVSAEKNGFGSWSHKITLNPGQYEVEYTCKTLHPYSSQVHNNYARRKAQENGELYKRIDYGFGKTTFNFEQGKSYFFQAQYQNLRIQPKQELGSFTGKCTLAQINKMSFMDTFQSNLKNIK